MNYPRKIIELIKGLFTPHFSPQPSKREKVMNQRSFPLKTVHASDGIVCNGDMKHTHGSI